MLNHSDLVKADAELRGRYKRSLRQQQILCQPYGSSDYPSNLL